MGSNKISIKQMQKLNELENKLAQRDAKKPSTDLIPENTPLGQEIKKQQAIAGEDLSGLPPGHPLLRMLAEAQQRYENQSGMPFAAKMRPTQTTVSHNQGIKRNAKAEREEEEREASRVLAAHKVNRCIEQTDKMLRELLKEIIDNEALINTEHVGKLRLARLKRMADAMRRLLGESRIPGARA